MTIHEPFLADLVLVLKVLTVVVQLILLTIVAYLFRRTSILQNVCSFIRHIRR